MAKASAAVRSWAPQMYIVFAPPTAEFITVKLALIFVKVWDKRCQDVVRVNGFTVAASPNLISSVPLAVLAQIVKVRDVVGCVITCCILLIAEELKSN